MAVLRRRARERPEDPYLEDADGEGRLTYGQTWIAIRRWAGAYATAGVRVGDTVAVMAPLSPDAVCSWLGLAFIGAVEVPVNPALKGTLLHHVLTDSQASVLLVAPECLTAVLDIVDTLPHLRLIVTAAADVGGASATNVVDLEAFLDAGAATVVEHPQRARDTACVLYTSGTTGPPKGAQVTWGQLYATAIGLPVFDELTSADAYYSPFPGFHIGGKHPVYVMALAGGRLVLKERFRTQDFWTDVNRHGCTVTFLLSAMSQFLLDLPPDDAERRSPLRLAMMVPMPPEPAAVERRFGLRISTIFNMTEVSVPIRSLPGQPHHSGSCGYLRPGYAARIVDADDCEVPDGGVGELVLRSDLPWVHASGYWNAPEKTLESWRNLWFHTGDAFRRDADGAFHFVDRMKDVIRRRGENISSYDIESACLEVAEIQACAAVGVPSEYGEEEVLLVAVPTELGAIDAGRLAAELGRRLPPFMVPAFIELVTELPMTPTQKIRKAELRRRGVTNAAYATRSERRSS